MDLDYELFRGVSIQLNDVNTAEEKAAKLAALPAVKDIWPIRIIPRPNPTTQWVATDGVSALSKLNQGSGSLNSRGAPGEAISIHKMCQIDKLREKGITGRGVKIAVVDTGVSTSDPRLAHSWTD